MGVSKSGYYPWRGRQGKLNRYEQDRQLLTKLLTEQHKKHPSHGYHMLAKAVFEATGWVFSHNLAHKYCKQAVFVLTQGSTPIKQQEKNMLSFRMK